MTANITTGGKVKAEAEAKSGLFADGTAGLAFAIELSDADIKTDFNGTMIAEMQPGSIVKIEIDPTVTNPSDIGYVDYERNMIHVGPTALVTEDQITYTSRRGINIGNLISGQVYYVITAPDDPLTTTVDESEEWIQLAVYEADSIAGNALDINQIAGVTTSLNTKAFDSAAVDDEADTINLDMVGINNTYELGQAVVYHQNGGPAIPGLVEGGTYYVITAIDQYDLQGNSRFTENQIIRLAETENEARAGVWIDIGPAASSVYDYTLGAKHVLDSGLATGIGVLSSLEAEDKATSEAGMESEDSPSNKASEFLDKYTSVTGFNIFGKIFEALTASYKKEGPSQGGGSKLAVTGALTFSYADHDVITTIGSQAVLKSNEDLEVRATIKEKMQYSTESSFEPQTNDKDESTGSSAATSFSVAITIGIVNNNAQVIVNSGARLDGLRATRIISKVEYPYLQSLDEAIPLSMSELLDSLRTEGLEYVNNWLDGTLGIKSRMLNTWTRASGQADKVSIAGAITVLVLTNTAESIVHSGVLINQDTAWRSTDKLINPVYYNHPNQTGEQTVSIEASNYLQMFNMTGIFDLQLPSATLDPLNPEFEGGSASVGSSGKKGGFGGAFYLSFIDNTTRAVVESTPTSQTKIYSGYDGGFNIKADELFFKIDLGQAGANSSKIGVAGTVLYTQHDSDTIAQISSDAKVTGRTLTMYAASLGTQATYAGAVVKGEGLGVGISVAVNNVNRTVKALIGADDVLNSTGSGPSVGPQFRSHRCTGSQGGGQRELMVLHHRCGGDVHIPGYNPTSCWNLPQGAFHPGYIHGNASERLCRCRCGLG